MSIETKTIGELKLLRFFVPSYQRGYRWTKSEVVALLNDINEFSAEGGKRYCIQPLIVKRRPDGSFEVVDGQQRLTTIYIFMQIVSQEIRSAVPPYELEYETRGDSADFLKSLSADVPSDSEKNIDFHHMASAYEQMNEWINNQPDTSVAIQMLNTKMRKDVYFIWYEMLHEGNPIEMFTKVNLGKIPLTCAELIKALLLSKDNFDPGGDIYKKQIEISAAWDRIEQGLRDDSFWYFLNEKEREGTRIDLLFELLANDYNARLNTPVPANEKYFSFLVFSEHLNICSDRNKKNDFTEELWNNVEKLYAEFRSWYSDLDMYHIIGYLISSGVKLKDIVTHAKDRRKSDVMSGLLEKAKMDNYDPERLSYDNSYDRQKIRKILLLFNIATLVCKSEKQYRFPFDIYKGETGDRIKWDIEHIHASADETDDADDNIGNLALLDAETNRGYKNAPFEEKRGKIIERESNGLFVPLCTKNVFLKVYSDNLDDMTIWKEEDKQSYVNVMKQTLESFFKGSFRK